MKVPLTNIWDAHIFTLKSYVVGVRYDAWLEYEREKKSMKLIDRLSTHEFADHTYIYVEEFGWIRCDLLEYLERTEDDKKE